MVKNTIFFSVHSAPYTNTYKKKKKNYNNMEKTAQRLFPYQTRWQKSTVFPRCLNKHTGPLNNMLYKRTNEMENMSLILHERQNERIQCYVVWDDYRWVSWRGFRWLLFELHSRRYMHHIIWWHINESKGNILYSTIHSTFFSIYF